MKAVKGLFRRPTTGESDRVTALSAFRSKPVSGHPKIKALPVHA